MHPDSQNIFNDIRAYCIKHSNPVLVERYARYFREGYDAYGLSEEILHKKVREVLDNHCGLGLKGFLDTGDLLIASGKYEEASFAILLVEEFKKKFTKSTLKHFGKWLEMVKNWAHCDIMCGRLISYCLQNNIAEPADISSWRKSDYKFKRRAVPVSLIPLIKGENAEHQFFLDFAEPMMSDEERVVHQGLGWFLRETWKQNPVPVEEFLLKWKDTAPRLIFQYATEKMSPAQKQRFRKSKK